MPGDLPSMKEAEGQPNHGRTPPVRSRNSNRWVKLKRAQRTATLILMGMYALKPAFHA